MVVIAAKDKCKALVGGGPDRRHRRVVRFRREDWIGVFLAIVGMDRTERSRPGFEIPVALGAYGDCQRPKTSPDSVDCDSGVNVFVGVNADDDFDRVGLAHVEGSPEVRT